MRWRIVLLACLVVAAGCTSQSPAPPAAKPRTAAPPAPVSVQVVLPSQTVAAGSQLTGHVVVNNSSGHAIRTAGCGALFTVALASKSYHPIVATLSCLQFFTIPKGRSSYRVHVLGSYLGCSVGHPRGGLQACLPGLKAPPLPPGRYRATLYFQVKPFAPAPPAIPVTVIPG
jgi:hypothetical protein